MLVKLFNCAQNVHFPESKLQQAYFFSDQVVEDSSTENVEAVTKEEEPEDEEMETTKQIDKKDQKKDVKIEEKKDAKQIKKEEPAKKAAVKKEEKKVEIKPEVKNEKKVDEKKPADDAKKSATDAKKTAADAKKKESGKSLWVSNLSSITRAADLKTRFSQYGKVGYLQNDSIIYRLHF